MLINEQTKIAALLKHHPDALETIITISPDFKKLRNPILRKLMAGRTSIAMASKIGGCQPEDFFKALAPLGFEVDVDRTIEPEENTDRKPLPDILKNISKEKIVVFDVRDMLASGSDPLKLIQQKIKELQKDEILQIINTFEPVPLIKLLEKQGFQSFVDVVSDNQIDTYFYSSGKEINTAFSNSDTNEESSDWGILLNKYKNNTVEIDVRHLEMPMPMMTILENLETLPVGKALFVHHKRIPVFLLTELKERNFDYRIKEIQEGEVYLLIFHQND
ncbi:MAG: DUF2249 domain-containing protein [Bacteroidetes bacterium]|nr:DUF2249 domain-containing protein [Bacteroidota bacterium]